MLSAQQPRHAVLPFGCARPHPCPAQSIPGSAVNSLRFVGNAVVKPGPHAEARAALSGAERARYQAAVAAHRPFRLELLRWNHDSEGPEAETFEQLQCLTGDFRASLAGGAGGGLQWTQLELEGVFLRHRTGKAMVWLPEAGPNLLLQLDRGGPWSLLEVVQLEKQARTKDKTTKQRDLQDVAFEIQVAMPVATHPRAKLREADPHLTDDWLEAAEDLRLLWSWDWRPLRSTSPFEFVQDKLVCAPGYPIADVTRGLYGETRWQWRFLEDGQGHLMVRNQYWPSGAQVYISEGDVTFKMEDGTTIIDLGVVTP